MTMKPLHVCILLPLLGALAFGAQPPTPAISEEDTITLNPFSVQAEKDQGYIAHDTISGGRLSMNLLKAPNDVSVLTRDFLDDIGASSVLEAAQWLTSATVVDPGSQAATQPDNRDFGGAVSFRGLSNTTNTRDYFTYSTSVQEYLVERVEGARGPTAIVYGDGGGGGQMNVITKRAGFRNFLNVQLRADSEGSLRGSIDMNRKLTPTLAARLNAFVQDRRTWVSGYYDKRKAADLAVTYRPWRGAEVRFEGEYGTSDVAPFRHAFSDAVSLWDGRTTLDAPLTSGSASGGLVLFTTDRIILTPSYPGVLNLRNFARTQGTGLTILDQPRAVFGPTPPSVPRGFRINPPEEKTASTTYNAAIFLQQGWNNGAVIELAASKSGVLRNNLNFYDNDDVYVDPNRVLPNGAPNPNFGKYYTESTQSESVLPEFFDNLRAAAAYPLTTSWLKQTFSVVAQRRVKNSDPRTYGFTRIADPTNPAISPSLSNSANQVYFRRYFDQPTAPLVRPASLEGYGFLRYNTRHTHTDSTTDAIQLNLISELLDGQLTVLAGARADKVSNFTRTGLYDANGHRAGDRLEPVDSKATTRSAGFTYFPTSWVGVYSNYSEGFRPQGEQNPWIGARGPVMVSPSRGWGYGLRFRAFDGKLVGSVGGYQTREEDRYVQVSNARTWINNLWNAINLGERTIAGPFAIISDTLDYAGRGWEADLTANVAQRFRLKFNFAVPKTLQTDSLPDMKAYYRANLETWRAGITPANASVIATNLANIENTLANASDGREINGKYKWRANVFGNYEIGSGPLRRLRLGLGANFFGPRLLGSPTSNPYEYIYSDQYALVTATSSYAAKINRVPVDFSLTVSNLLDYDRPVYTGVLNYAGGTHRNYFNYVPPRLASLTVTLRF